MTPLPPIRQRCDRPRSDKAVPWGYRPGAVCVVALSRARFPREGETPRYRLDRVTESGTSPMGDHHIAAVASGVPLVIDNEYSPPADEPVYRSIAIVGRPKSVRARDLWAAHGATVWTSLDEACRVVEPYLDDLP